MKRIVLVVGYFLILCIVSFAMAMPQIFLNPYYNVRYHWSHLPTKPISSFDPSIFEKFGAVDSGGSYQYSNQIHFSYSSHHNSVTHTYYYKFANIGEYPLCVTSQGFAYLLGNVNIHLFPGESEFWVLKDEHTPTLRSYKLHFHESCGWLSYNGGSLELTLPAK